MEYNIEGERNNKRKSYDNNDDYEYIRVAKKSKFEIDNSLIYAIGKEVHFTGGINQDSIERVIKLFTKIIYEHEKKHPNLKKKLNIVYIIDSPGGSVTSILKFVDYVKMTKKKYPHITYTSVINGMAASAGTIMAVTADHRKMTKNAFAMIHELATNGGGGKYTHITSYGKHLTNMHNTLLDIYMTVAKNTRSEVEVLLKDESWYTAKEYLELGFVDEII